MASRRQGTISKLPSGSYRVRVSLGKRPDGTRNRYTRTWPTLQEARDDLARVAGTGANPSRQGFGDYLDHYIETRRTGTKPLAERTLHEYQNYANRYVRVHPIGNAALRDIDVVRIEAFYTWMMSKEDGPGVGAKSVHQMHAVISGAIKRAARGKLVTQNHALLVELPEKERTSKATILRQSEIGRFLEAVDADRNRALWRVFLGCGLRLSEALGLQWQDHDGRDLTIRRIWDTKLRKMVPATKSNGSVRTLTVPAEVRSALQAHRRQQMEEKLRAEPCVYDDQGWVFARPDGRVECPDTQRDHMYAMRDAAGLPPIRIHDLRHTIASHLVRSGTDLARVRDMMGHATVQFLLDTYVHSDDDARQQTASDVDRLLGTG